LSFYFSAEPAERNTVGNHVLALLSRFYEFSAKAARDPQRFTCDPCGIRRREEDNGWGDIARLTNAAQRRLPFDAPVTRATLPASFGVFEFVLMISFVSIGMNLSRGQMPGQMIYLLVSMKSKHASARMGRPRAFDVDLALDRALHVFWHKGYEGASLSDLTKAMRINRPSLYAAFGNKEELFRKALDRYAEGPAAYVRGALKEPTAHAVTEKLLRGAIDTVTDPQTPAGCFMVQGALACGDAADAIRREVSARRSAAEAALRRRFQRAKRERDLPSNADPSDLARYIVTVMHGMAVQRAGGATRTQLLRVMKVALRAWPN